MRILHTADWHIGRIHHGLPLLEDQAHILEQFVTLVHEKKPDAVIIAGDVYDRSVPSAEAVRLLDSVLERIVIEAGVTTFLIAGNHDGPDRLEFGSRMLAEAGLVVRGVPEAEVAPVILADAHGEVAFYPLPYLEPSLARSIFGDDTLSDHEAALAAQMARVRASHHPARRAVVIAHAFVQGGAAGDSERPLTVGGSGAVRAEVFDGMHFVALGHLHGSQSVSAPHIHYSGSLLKYSFAEAAQPKSVSLVELDGQGRVSIERISLKPLRDLRIIEGHLADLMAAGVSDPNREDYILARLTDTGALLDPMGKLRTVYPNALSIERATSEPGEANGMARQRGRAGIHELFAGFYKEVTGNDLGEEAQAMLAAEIAALEQNQREVAA